MTLSPTANATVGPAVARPVARRLLRVVDPLVVAVDPRAEAEGVRGRHVRRAGLAVLLREFGLHVRHAEADLAIGR